MRFVMTDGYVCDGEEKKSSWSGVTAYRCDTRGCSRDVTCIYCRERYKYIHA